MLKSENLINSCVNLIIPFNMKNLRQTKYIDYYPQIIKEFDNALLIIEDFSNNYFKNIEYNDDLDIEYKNEIKKFMKEDLCKIYSNEINCYNLTNDFKFGYLGYLANRIKYFRNIFPFIYNYQNLSLQEINNFINKYFF